MPVRWSGRDDSGGYQYYLDRDSVIEERNGSNQTIKQMVWGKTYIDELIQTSYNSYPSNQTTCDTPYWAEQDANWNVIRCCRNIMTPCPLMLS